MDRPDMPAVAKFQTTKSSANQKSPAKAARTAAGRTERNCSVARTLDIVSDAWAFLIIREAFFGTQTFEAFRSALGIPRATLTDRLKKLTQLAIFRQVTSGSSQRKEYRLTKMGFDLYPSFIALMQFGDRWLSKGKPPPLTLVHKLCGCDSHPVVTCSHCGESIGARDAKYRDGPGAGRCPAKPGRNTRRPSDGSRFVLGRPSSVSRALEVIGDKWSFMVVREGFFGNRRYDKILTELAIAPNILTDRLNRLVASGVFHRRQTATNICSPIWDEISTVPLSQCCDGAIAGSPKVSLLSSSPISHADTTFSHPWTVTAATNRSSQRT
jgi:DNA-binding HxlR family transcriptional regulator